MGRGWILGPILAAAAVAGLATPAPGQTTVIDRDTKVTGPRGRTTERDIRVQRGPGYIDRQVEIKRPGETIVRDTRIATGGGGGGGRPWGGPGPGFGPGPRFYGGPRVIEEVFVPRAPVVSTFVGVPFFNLFLGGGGPPPPPPPPPPPVVVYPEGVIYAQPGVVAGPAPAPPISSAPPPQEQLVLDQMAEPLGRLKSFHSNTRRDGALELGHLGDDRAVTPLIDRLQHDTEKEVRVAAAWALGELGDPRAGVALERAALYDKRHEVRDAATIAHRRLPKPGQEQAQPGGALPEGASVSTARRQAMPQPNRPTIVGQPEVLDPGPAPLDNSPPPPPSPPVEGPRDRS